MFSIVDRLVGFISAKFMVDSLTSFSCTSHIYYKISFSFNIWHFLLIIENNNWGEKYFFK